MDKNGLNTKIQKSLFVLFIGIVLVVIEGISIIGAVTYVNDVYLVNGGKYVGDDFKGNVYIYNIKDVRLVDAYIEGNLFIEDAETIYIERINLDGKLYIKNSIDIKILESSLDGDILVENSKSLYVKNTNIDGNILFKESNNIDLINAHLVEVSQDGNIKIEFSVIWVELYSHLDPFTTSPPIFETNIILC